MLLKNIIFVFLYFLNEFKCESPFIGSGTIEYANHYGYNVKTHKVTTEDGYILTLYHLKNPKNITSPPTKRGPIIVAHGMLGSSTSFVGLGPNISIGYRLMENGYDVWLFNARGTNVRRHLVLDPNDVQFWNYSWHEIGLYDLPAVIDYVIKKTGHSQVFYLGYSQGVSIFYVLMSMRPEYNDKIRLAHHFGSPIFTRNLRKRPGWRFLKLIKDIEIFNDLRYDYLVPIMENIRVMLSEICAIKSIQTICAAFISTGENLAQFPMEMLPALLSFAPSPVSTRQCLHYAQNVISGKFTQYNYGYEKNIQIYNNTEPPEYDLSSVTAPVAHYFGARDQFVGTDDRQRLANLTKNLVLEYLVPYPHFTHGDFVLAKDVQRLLYDKVFEIMNKY